MSSDFAQTATAHQPPAPPTSRRVHHPAYRPVGVLGGLTVAVAALVTLGEVVQAIAAFSAGEEYLRAARAGAPMATVGTTFWDLSYYPIALGMVLAYFVTCAWLYRARMNAETFVPWMSHKRSAVWAWLGWWMPIVNLWFPYQVVRDVLRAGRGQVAGAGGVGWWWASRLLMVWTSQIGLAAMVYFLFQDIMRHVQSGGTAEGIRDLPPSETWAQALPWLEVGSAGVAVVAFLLWWMVVTEIDRDQEARAVLAAREAGITA